MCELLLLTVILVLFRRKRKRKYPFCVHKQYHKETTPTRCISWSDVGCIMEDRCVTQDELISRNQSYRDLQASWLEFGGNLATPLFRCKSPLAAAWIAPPSGKKLCAASACHSAHMESGLYIFHVSNFCHFRAAATPPIWIHSLREKVFACKQCIEVMILHMSLGWGENGREKNTQWSLFSQKTHNMWWCHYMLVQGLQTHVHQRDKNVMAGSLRHDFLFSWMKFRQTMEEFKYM